MSRLQNVKSDMNTERLVEYTNRLKVTLQSQSQEKLNIDPNNESNVLWYINEHEMST